MNCRPSAVFAVVPYCPIGQPSIASGIIKKALEKCGWNCRVLYLNEDMNNHYNGDFHRDLDTLPSQLLIGEAIFSKALWDSQAIDWDVYVDQCENWMRSSSFEPSKIACCLDILRRCRVYWEAAPEIVSRWLDACLNENPEALLLSSTFQQSTAALALAKKAKNITPSSIKTIVMGGANCEGEMGETLLDSFPFLDIVFSGEVENSIDELISVMQMEQPQRMLICGRMLEALDRSDTPDFSDYFDEYSDQDPDQRVVAVESSRGCWWGQKRHCCVNLGSVIRSGQSRSRPVVSVQAPPLSSQDHPSMRALVL